jgi:hypothetical protein
MKRILTAVLLLASASAMAECNVVWTIGDSGDDAWLDGYKFYQGGALTHTLSSPTARTASCADVALVPAGGAVTMTAFRGDSESPQSAPATFVMEAPGLHINLSFM